MPIHPFTLGNQITKKDFSDQKILFSDIRQVKRSNRLTHERFDTDKESLILCREESDGFYTLNNKGRKGPKFYDIEGLEIVEDTPFYQAQLEKNGPYYIVINHSRQPYPICEDQDDDDDMNDDNDNPFSTVQDECCQPMLVDKKALYKTPAISPKKPEQRVSVVHGKWVSKPYYSIRLIESQKNKPFFIAKDIEAGPKKIIHGDTELQVIDARIHDVNLVTLNENTPIYFGKFNGQQEIFAGDDILTSTFPFALTDSNPFPRWHEGKPLYVGKTKNLKGEEHVIVYGGTILEEISPIKNCLDCHIIGVVDGKLLFTQKNTIYFGTDVYPVLPDDNYSPLHHQQQIINGKPLYHFSRYTDAQHFIVYGNHARSIGYFPSSNSTRRFLQMWHEDGKVKITIYNTLQGKGCFLLVEVPLASWK